MDFLFYYTNLIRAIVVIATVIRLVKHDYKKIMPAVTVLVLSFIPWLLSLIDIQLNTLAEFLFQTVVFLAMFLGSGFRIYDKYAWWDRCVHWLSGIMFYSVGITLADKAPDAGFAGTLVFSFALSLALHEIWEVSEFLVDSIFHTDHQHWQKHSSVANHQPKKAIQPPGLVDTMSDTIAGIIGTICACVGWWIYFTV